MSTPVKPLPPANRILAAGWAEQEHAAHQSRLALMRPLVNSSAPACSRVKIKRLKQKVATEMENERIDRENRILLQRMSRIQCRPSPALPAPTAPTPAAALAQAKTRSLNSAVRAREQERIAEENLALVARLKRGRGYQEFLALDRHEKEYTTLKQAGQRARLPPAAIPAPKFSSPGGAGGKGGSQSDRADGASSGMHSLGKSASQGGVGLTAMLGALQQRSNSSPGHARPTSQQGSMSASASLAALSLNGNGRTRGSLRPMSEWQDERGAVEPISASSFPSFTPRSSAAKGAVQVGQESAALIDGRDVTVTLDEITPAEDSDAADASAADPALLHCFLFRTYEASSQQRDHVTVPYSIVSSLPECTQDGGAMLRPERRDMLAECLFNRLRFHQGKLAFNPSHALRGEKRADAGADESADEQQAALWDAVGSDGRVRPATAAETEEWDRAVAGGRRDGTASPDLERSPRGAGAAGGRKRRPAAHGATPGKSGSQTLLTASGALPAALSPAPKPLRLIGRHHMSTTLATVVRAGALAPAAQQNIQAARADREKKLAYKQLLHERSRSNSPTRAVAASSSSPSRRSSQPNFAKAKAETEAEAAAKASAAPVHTLHTHDQPDPEPQQQQQQEQPQQPQQPQQPEPTEPSQVGQAKAEPEQKEQS